MKTIIVIPIYRHVEGTERVSLDQCMRVLGNHEIVAIHPQRLDISEDLRSYPSIRRMALRDDWFDGVAGYNRMMLSTEFYNKFAEYDYMLIYQLDAYVFSDQLDYWTSLGYDYIGAPWIMSTNFLQQTFGMAVRWLRRTISPIKWGEHVHHCHFSDKVGNGGFCLRRISKMIEMTEKYAPQIAELKFGVRGAQEDVFFAIVAGRYAKLKTPKRKEAIAFSWEDKLDWCRKQLKHLPFGCHAWQTDKHIDFWRQYIVDTDSNEAK